MQSHPLSRREFLKTSVALSIGVFAEPARASPPSPEAITPALIAAAKKEGLVVWYTSADLQLAEIIGKAFEQKFSGITARVERAVGERIVDAGGLRSLHAQVKDKPGRTPLSAIKVWKDDPAAVEAQGEEIKRRYSEYFRV